MRRALLCLCLLLLSARGLCQTSVLDAGDAAFLAGTYERAVDLYQRAVSEFRTAGDRAGEARALFRLGNAWYALSRYDQAVAALEQAVAIRRALNDRSGTSSVLNNLGNCYYVLAQYDRARDAYEAALAIERELHDRMWEGRTLVNLGTVYLSLARYDQAVAYFEQGLAIHRELHDTAAEARALNNIGNVYLASGRYEQAIATLEQARALHEPSLAANLLATLGNAYADVGRLDEAVATLTEALAARRATRDRAGEGRTLNDLGLAYKLQGRLDSALDAYQQALAIAREVNDPATSGVVLNNLMNLYRGRGMTPLAICFGKLSIQAAQQIRHAAGGMDDQTRNAYRNKVESRYRTLAGLLIEAGRLPEAEQVLELLKSQELHDVTRAGPPPASVALAPGEQAMADRYAQISGQLESLGQESARLAALQHRTPQDQARLDEVNEDLKAARGAFNQFLGNLQQRLASSSRAGRVETLTSLQSIRATLKQLGPGSVLVWTLVTDDAYRAVLLTADAPPKSYTVPIDAAKLRTDVLAFRQALQDSHLDPRPSGEALYDVLVKPLAADLEQAGARTVMWSLDDVLRYIPMNALYDGRRYLIEAYCNVVWTTAGRDSMKDVPAPAWSVAGLGVSEEHPGFVALRGVPQELRSIVRSDGSPDGVLAGDLRLDSAFTEKVLEDDLGGRYQVLHLATHFNLDAAAPNQSFLLLGDGSHLDLPHLSLLDFTGVDLLTLSACNTGSGETGDGKEVESLAMLAQERGARAVVASLWPVSDASTPVLMRAFYRNRQAHPDLGKGDALRQAQLALLNGKADASGAPASTRGAAPDQPESGFPLDPERPFAHPYYWAPFILLGNWR